MSILTDVIGGVMGANAAGKAANAQVGGAQEAAQTVKAAADAGNGEIRTAANNGGANVVNAGVDAGAQVLGTAAAGANSVTTAAQLANVGLDPYASAGSMAAGRLNTGLAAGGDLSKTFTAADMEANDPGYQFRLQQGQQALERQAAARGAVSGGGEAKALVDYAQGAASSEYQNAFNRFTTNQQNNVQNLQKLADSGQTAATTQGGNTTGAAGTAAGLLGAGAVYAGNIGVDTNKFNASLTTDAAKTTADNENKAAEYVGNSQVYAGNARATGIVGKNNAYTGMMSGLGGGEVTDFLKAGASAFGLGG